MIAEKGIGPKEFETALGLGPDELDERTQSLLREANLRYRPIDATGQTKLQAEIAEQIENGFTVVGEHRAAVWRDAWQEQLERFEQSNYDLKALNPKFVAHSPVLRWQGEYVEGLTSQFELVFLEILRDWVFRKFLSDVGHLYEFGSGSAFNLAAYAKLFPDVPMTALDWAPAAVRIAQLLQQRLGMKVSGHRFDFFAPGSDMALAPGSGVLTMCALEQTGNRFGPFIDYVLGQRPRRVVHVEPTLELYEPASRHDQLAIEYHRRRKYLDGLLTALGELQRGGRLRLIFSRRLRFGSRFHECFSVHAWEPL